MTRGGTSNRAFYQASTSLNGNYQLINNIFSNTGGGYAIYVAQTSSISVSNFNDFYATGINLGYWLGNRTTLSAWIAASAKDGNSVSLDPSFTSNTDLHSCAVGLSNAGTPVVGVTDDIDGAARDLSFPDIGADEFDTALTVNLGTDTSACGAFVLDAGNPGSTYNWSTGSSSQSITATVTGQYYVDVTNACGIEYDTINVNINSTLFVDLGVDTTICSGGNMVLDAGNAGATFVWSTSATTQTIVAASTGTYTVNVDNGFCSGDDTIVVTISSPIVLTTGGTDENCGGGDGTATVNTSGGTAPYAYIWDDPGAQTNATAIALAAGTYNVTVTDVNACMQTSSRVVGSSASLSSSISGSSNISCFAACDGSASVTIVGGTAPFTYLWDDPSAQTNAGATSLCAGTYIVLVTDNSTCTSTDTVTLTEPTELILIPSSVDASCSGADGSASIFVTGGAPGYIYIWNDLSAQTTATANNLSSGSYIVMVTDVSGCSKNDTVTVSNAAAMSASISFNTNANCFGDCNMLASANVSGGTAPFTYLWDDPSAQNAATATGLCAGMYVVQITDAAGCSASDSINITEPALLVANTSTTNATCGNADGTATASPTGGTGPFSYIWDDSSSQTIATAVSLGAGNYNVTVTDFNGCIATMSATVSTTGGLSTSISAFTNASCFGVCDGNISVNVSGGITPLTYLWDDPSAQSTPVATALCAGTYSITVIDNAGCVSLQTQTITEPGQIVLNIFTTFATCGLADGTAGVSASGGVGPYAYLWNDGSSQTSATATGLIAGAYSAMVTDGNACTGIATALVTDSSSLVTVITATTPASCFASCDGQSIVTTSGGATPYAYLWNDPATQSTAGASNLCAGSYTVVVTDANGCVSVQADTITEPAAIVLTMSSTNATQGNTDGSASISVSGGIAPYVYLWDDPALQTTTTASSLGAGLYTVVLTDANGCSVSDTISVVENGGGGGSISVSITFTSNIDCFGDCDGIASVVPFGGTAPYTYLWDDPFAQSNNTATDLCVGTYTVFVTDLAGDTGSVSATITDSPEILLSLTSVDANCAAPDGTATVVASGGAGGFTYVWSDPSAQTSSVATALTPGTYTVAVTDVKGCLANDTAVVGNAGSITATINFNTTSDCNSDCDALATASITGGTSPYTYLWDDPLAQSNTTAVDLCAGTYIVRIDDAAGCTDADTITIIEPTSLNVMVTGNNVTPGSCDGSMSASVTGGTTPYSYIWNDPSASTNAAISNLCPATYNVTVTDGNSCTQLGSANIADTTVGIETLTENVAVNIYPNPSTGEFGIEITSARDEVKSIRIIDLMGKIVYAKDVNVVNKNVYLPVNLFNESSGVYEVQVVTERGIVRRTIVIN